MFDLAIEGGRVVSSTGIAPATVVIANGRIAALADPGTPVAARERIDARDLLVLPGLVDAHVHLRDPGLTHKEDFGSGTAAAAIGGVTTVMVMPTDKPMTLTADDFVAKREIGESKAYVDFALQALLGPDTTAVDALADLGAVSFEIFLGDFPPPAVVTDGASLAACLLAVRTAGRRAGITPADDSVIARASRTVGAAAGTDLAAASRRAFLDARPPLSEALGVARACVAARETGCRIHIRQASTRATVDVLLGLGGPLVSAEVTPHNLLLDERAILEQGPWAKVAPPLRVADDLKAVGGALRIGLIDLVATDHAPHAPAEKEAGMTDLALAPGGFPGLQTFLPLMLLAATRGAFDDLPALVRACCEAPAQRFGLYPRKGSLLPGADADLVLVDPARDHRITNAAQASLAGRTPFDGWVTPGVPVMTILRGRVIAKDGALTGARHGAFVRP